MPLFSNSPPGKNTTTKHQNFSFPAPYFQDSDFFNTSTLISLAGR
ncbi:hypothetical protein FDUTEX481_07982 [Tolypothrix sp. PCC 7601]|nr:hypothetical protein FDUTEX481_07982 [Tolypothrix sp. PCC 7601]